MTQQSIRGDWEHHNPEKAFHLEENRSHHNHEWCPSACGIHAWKPRIQTAELSEPPPESSTCISCTWSPWNTSSSFSFFFLPTMCGKWGETMEQKGFGAILGYGFSWNLFYGFGRFCGRWCFKREACRWKVVTKASFLSLNAASNREHAKL